MKNIVDIGQAGAEYMDVVAPQPHLSISGVDQFVSIIDRLPTTRLSREVHDGTKRDIEVHTLPLSNPKVFNLLWQLAPYEPMVYASRAGQPAVMGILSPNFDTSGFERLPSLKVLTLRTPYPLLSKGSSLLPDANMATMLAGSAHAEGPGSGGHDRPPAQDYEHKQTILGAISLRRTTILSSGEHVQHAERSRSSVAAGLTNGKLGNLYTPDSDTTAGFTGYGLPVLFDQASIRPTDAIYIPKSFLQADEAYGVHYNDAARIAYGAGLQILYQRHGQQAVSDQVKQIAQVA